ncbi:NfeD family protein [Intestinibacillus massiliensis]|uniref:NfeD family protein n=1 Tax=Intestinibacillus massiliensis TaxID=1871029 RepID=UPI0013564377|nr:NfeD family protein [Intestinibacillus massiliensis]
MIIGGTFINIVYIWVAALVVTVAIEAFTLNLTSIWFSVGALAALILASIGLSPLVQMVVFVVVSALLLILVRPLTRKFLRVRGEKTNADRIIGQQAIVTVAIDNALSQGEIKLLGQNWSARSQDNSKIAVGTTVRVLSIAGVKAIVEELQTQEVQEEAL